MQSHASSGGWLSVYHVTVLGDPAPRTAFQPLRWTFTFKDQCSRVEGAAVPTMLPPFSCSQKPGLPKALHPDSNNNSAHSEACHLSWLWIMQLLLKTGLNPSLRLDKSYSWSFEQPHASSPPTFWSHCHSSWNVFPNISILTHTPSSLQAPVLVLLPL